VPSLGRLIEEAAQSVADPVQHIPVAAAWRARTAADRGSLPTGAGNALVNTRLGSGSDYTVFLNFLGVPVADLTFDGPYGVYHSIYDNHHWVSRIGDPGFRYHAALTQVWGLVALRLANADALPLDYAAYSTRIREFLDEPDRQWLSVRLKPETTAVTPDTSAQAASADRDITARPRPDTDRIRLEADHSPELAAAFDAARRFERAAEGLRADIDSALAAGIADRFDTLNKRLKAVERAFIDPGGLPGRPWYRHQIYAPTPAYAAAVLPGLAAAVASGDRRLLAEQARRLAAALDRAATALAR
jgi:N-acetylated-alpha-linked acidic dipeptidase